MKKFKDLDDFLKNVNKGDFLMWKMDNAFGKGVVLTKPRKERKTIVFQFYQIINSNNRNSYFVLWSINKNNVCNTIKISN